MDALLFTLLAVLLFSSTQGLNAADHSSTLKLFHVNSPLRSQSSVPWLDTLLETQSNDKARHKYLSSLVAGQKGVPIGRSNTYVVQAMIGTPPRKLLLSVDTNTDAGLVPCRGCLGYSCPRLTFNIGSSSSFNRIHCGDPKCKHVPNPACVSPNCWFTTQYGDSKVVAQLVRDNIALATYSFNYTFGCALQVSGNSFSAAHGLLGLGRGPLSLLSQPGNSYKSIFSYCLPSFKSTKSTGSLTLGPNKQPKRIKTTPLLTNYNRQSLYIVKLLAIAVDAKLINIPQAYSDTVIDTGTVFSTIVKTTYVALRAHVRNVMWNKLKANYFEQGVLDTCYSVPIIAPTITFMFPSMNMTLPPENIIINGTDGSPFCLAMAMAPNNINSRLNIISSYQQQNLRVLIKPDSVGIVRENCS